MKLDIKSLRILEALVWILDLRWKRERQMGTISHSGRLTALARKGVIRQGGTLLGIEKTHIKSSWPLVPTVPSPQLPQSYFYKCSSPRQSLNTCWISRNWIWGENSVTLLWLLQRMKRWTRYSLGFQRKARLGSKGVWYISKCEGSFTSGRDYMREESIKARKRGAGNITGNLGWFQGGADISATPWK